MRLHRTLLCAFVIGTVSLTPGATPPEKPAIAVLNLKSASGVLQGDAELLSDRLRIEFFNTGKYTVMERDQMQQVLKEQGFQQSGACTDEACMVEIGKLLGVVQLVTGSVGKLGRIYMINLRSIDIKTGKIMRVVSRDIKGDIEDLVKVLPDLADNLSGSTSVDKPEPPPEHQSRSEPARTVETPRQPMCGGKLLLEYLIFNRGNSRLGLADNEYAELNKDINDQLVDALNHVFNDKVASATADQLVQMSSCGDPVLRITLDNYTSAPARFKQTEITADVTLSFYDAVGATTPSFKVKVTKTGDRNWGDRKPFLNAFEAIGDELRHNLDRQDFIRNLQKRLKG